jgi:hypothetical protein
MKVGLSLSRCLRDIVEGNVLFEDVLVVIARTDVDPYNDAHWKQLFNGYLYGGVSHPEWQGMEDEEENLRNELKRLYKSGKLHQPRQYGAHPTRLPYYWLDTFAPEEEIAKNPAAQKAWDNYKLLAGLS